MGFDKNIFVLNGPSAGGKTTILEALTDGLDVGGKKVKVIDNVTKIITVTTRKPRPGEIDGVHYYFVDHVTFQKQKALGNVVEETEYPKGSGIAYGIYDSEIQRIRNAGMDAAVILDMHGVDEMKRFYGAENVVSIFVYRPLDQILKELKARPISEEEVKKRFSYAREEMENRHKCDYVIENVGTIEEAVIQAVKIIEEVRRKKQKKKSGHSPVIIF